MDVKLGDIGALDLNIVDGKVELSINVGKVGLLDGAVDVSNMAKATCTPRVFLDKLKAMIPGEIDDMVISALEAAFKI